MRTVRNGDEEIHFSPKIHEVTGPPDALVPLELSVGNDADPGEKGNARMDIAPVETELRSRRYKVLARVAMPCGAVARTVAFRGRTPDNGVMLSAGILDDAEKNPPHVRKYHSAFLKVRGPLHLDGIGVIEALASIVGEEFPTIERDVPLILPSSLNDWRDHRSKKPQAFARCGSPGSKIDGYEMYPAR
jgi:hypothetical protein